MAKKGASDRTFRTELSINDIRGLAWNAVQGSEQSYSILKAQNQKLAKIANSRLRALEAADLDMFAYDRAITYLKNQGKRRFSTKLAPATSFEGMVNQLSELVTFINAKSSTVKGAQKAMHDKMQKISEFTGTKYTDAQEYYLARLLGSDSVSTLLREVRGDSAEVIEVLEELSMDEANVEQTSRIIDTHLAGYNPWGDNSDYLSYDELMDELRGLYK